MNTLSNHPNRGKSKRHYSVLIGAWVGLGRIGRVIAGPVTDEGLGNVHTVYAGSISEAIRLATANPDDAPHRQSYDYTVEAWPDVVEYIIQARPGMPPYARCATYDEAQDAREAAYRLGTGWHPRMVAYCADGSERTV